MNKVKEAQEAVIKMAKYYGARYDGGIGKYLASEQYANNLELIYNDLLKIRLEDIEAFSGIIKQDMKSMFYSINSVFIVKETTNKELNLEELYEFSNLRQQREKEYLHLQNSLNIQRAVVSKQRIKI